MRAAPSFRLLLPAIALLASACEDSTSPLEPPAVEEAAPTGEGAPVRQDVGGAALLGDRAHWADGYLLSGDPTAASSGPAAPSYAFNRSGGPITITKPAGTTGRYVVTFSGLSRLIGSRNTVHATGFRVTIPGAESAYCKPAAAYLVSDKVEVRCFKSGTGAPVNSQFTLLVTRDYVDLAFAYAHKSTSTSYAPLSRGSWNPAGTTQVARSGVGNYLVTFNGLGAELPPSVGGHVQVNAVGTDAAHCEVGAWGGSPNMGVRVGCYTAAGAPVDAKFTVLFLMPSEHLAYALADQLSGSYSPNPVYGSNPTGGSILIGNLEVGHYYIQWTDVDPEIFEQGTVQVTAYGSAGAHCKVATFSFNRAQVKCFAPNGAPVNSYFTVLYGS